MDGGEEAVVKVPLKTRRVNERVGELRAGERCWGRGVC